MAGGRKRVDPRRHGCSAAPVRARVVPCRPDERSWPGCAGWLSLRSTSSHCRAASSRSSTTERTRRSGTTARPEGTSSGCTGGSGTGGTSTPPPPSAPRSPGYGPSGRTPICSSRNRSRPATAHPPSRRPQAGDTRICSVLRWMDGRIHEDSARPIHLRRLGDAMARLHDQADAWTPPPDFVRIRWDHETFFGNVMVYGETPAAECWDTPAGRGTCPLPGGGRPVGRGHAPSRRGRAHPRRPAPRQRALPGRRGQADRLRRLRHRPPALRPRRRPLGAAGRTELPGVPGRAARRVTERAGRSTSPTWTTSSRFGRSRSTSGTPAQPRSTLPSPRGSTGSTAGRWRCSTWWPSPETSRPGHPRCMNIQR